MVYRMQSLTAPARSRGVARADVTRCRRLQTRRWLSAPLSAPALCCLSLPVCALSGLVDGLFVLLWPSPFSRSLVSSPVTRSCLCADPPRHAAPPGLVRNDCMEGTNGCMGHEFDAVVRVTCILLRRLLTASQPPSRLPIPRHPPAAFQNSWKILGIDERHARLQPHPSCTYLCTPMNASWPMCPRPSRTAQPHKVSATWTRVSNVPHRTSATQGTYLQLDDLQRRWRAQRRPASSGSIARARARSGRVGRQGEQDTRALCAPHLP